MIPPPPSLPTVIRVSIWQPKKLIVDTVFSTITFFVLLMCCLNSAKYEEILEQILLPMLQQQK